MSAAPKMIRCTLFWSIVASIVSISIAVAQTRPLPPTLLLDGDSPGNPLFFDDFNYVVDRLDSATTKSNAFRAAGWAGVKDESTNPGRAFGYLYTVTNIPGFSGRMPGLSGSGRVLALEGLPTTLGDFTGSPGTWRNQTDFYLVYGNPAGPQTNVPGDIWYQFWIYVNDYGTQRTHWSNRNKLIYPSDDGTASGDGSENAYLVSLRPSSQANAVRPYGAAAYVVNKIEAGSSGRVESNSPEGPTYIGVNLQPDSGFIQPNRWELYKIHIDHASVNGRFEVWRRTMGGTWQKTTEWIGGVTPGFTWVTQSQLRAGHNLFKVPTTWGTAKSDDSTNYDAWVYIADFAVATRESDLPSYGSY